MNALEKLKSITPIDTPKNVATNKVPVTDSKSVARALARLSEIKPVEPPKKTPVSIVKSPSLEPKKVNPFDPLGILSPAKSDTRTLDKKIRLNKINSVIPDYTRAAAQYQREKESGIKNIDPYKFHAAEEQTKAEIKQLKSKRDEAWLELEGQTDKGYKPFNFQNSNIPEEEKQAYYDEVNRLRSNAEQADLELELKRQQLKGMSDEFYSSILTRPDFAVESQKGAKIQNPEYGAKKKDIKNVVEYVFDNLDKIEHDEKIRNTAPGIKIEVSSIYKHMTDNERGIYNYLISKYGSEEASYYLEGLTDTLNNREGKETASDINSTKNPISRVVKQGVTAISSGVTNWGKGTEQLFNEEAVSKTPTQYASKYIREDLNGIGGVVYDLIETSANMAPSILLSTLGSGLVSAVGGSAAASGATGKVVGALAMGGSSAGNAYNEKIREGYSPEQAKLYATLVGTSETCLQYLIGGISKLGVGANVGSVAQKILSVDNAFAKVALEFGINGIKEGIEEGLQTVLEPIFASLVFNEEYTPASIEEIAYSALVGFLSSGIFEGYDTISKTVDDSRTGKQLRQDTETYGEDVTGAVINEGLASSPNTEAYRLASHAQKRLDAGKNISNNFVGRMYNANVDAINAETKNTASETETDNSKKYMSVEDFTNTESPVWNNVEYEDVNTQNNITQQIHNEMVSSGNVVVVPMETMEKVGESYPDLRGMKKKDRTELLKDSIKSLKSNIRQFLSGLKNQSFEFEVNGNILEAKLYTTGINEVTEKLTEQKSNMLYSSAEIFRNARYLYSTPDYDGSNNVYRWNYFYTPVQIGENTVGVRIAVRDMIKQEQSQIYHWGIKKDTPLDGVRDDFENRKSHDVSSDVSEQIISQPDTTVKSDTVETLDVDTMAQEAEFTPEPAHNDVSEKNTSLLRGDTFSDTTVLPTAEQYMRDNKAAQAETRLEETGYLLGVDEKIINDVLDISKTLRRDIEFVYSKDAGDEAWFDRESGKICVNANSDNFTSDYIGILAHDITHTIEGAQGYEKLYNMVIKKYSASQLQELQAEWSSRYDARGKKISGEAANREIVADYVRRHLFTDKNAITEAVKIDRSFGTTMKGILDRMLSLFGNKNARERVFLARARRYYAEALNQSGIVARSESNTDTDYEYTEQHSYSDGAKTDNASVFSDGDVEIPSGESLIDKISVKEYNTRGWSYSLFSVEDLRLLDERWKLALSSKYKNKTLDGLSVIKINNKVIFASGTYNNPIIESVLVYNAGNEAELIANEIVIMEGNNYEKLNTQGIYECTSLAQYLLGEKLCEIYNCKNYQSKTKGIGEDGNRRAVQPRGFKNFGYVGSYEFRDGVFLQNEREVSRRTQTFDGSGHFGNGAKSHSYSNAAPVTSSTPIIDSTPKVVQSNISRTEAAHRNDIGNIFAIPANHRKMQISEPMRVISEEYMREGTVSEETIQNVFESLYGIGIQESEAYIEHYSGTLEYIENLKGIKLTENELSQIPPSVANIFGVVSDTVKISTDNDGMSLPAVWKELNQRSPALFPKSVTSPAKRVERIINAIFDYSRAQKMIDETTSDNSSSKDYRLSEFTAQVRNSETDLRQAYRYMQWYTPRQSNNVSTDQSLEQEQSEPRNVSAPETYEDLIETFKSAASAHRELEKVQSKYLLTPSDKIQIGRILRGETELSALNPEKDNVEAITAILPAKIKYEEYADAIREYKIKMRERLEADVDRLFSPFTSFKDKKNGLMYSRETAERNFRDIAPSKEIGNALVSEYVTPIRKAEAEKTRYVNKLIQRVKDLKLSKLESQIVQQYGEAMDNLAYLVDRKANANVKRDGKTAQEWTEEIENIWESNPNVDRARIETAVQEFRDIYNELFEEINKARVLNGYEPIFYRRGYFPHFTEDSDGALEGLISGLGFSFYADTLPTAINGLTHTFRPGITWFSHAQERLGNTTTYDAVTGFEQYLSTAADVIFHTENIQRLRALSRRLRYNTTSDKVKEEIAKINSNKTLTEDERNTQIEAVYSSAADTKYTLSEFVKWLDDYTNILAGKKSMLDRTSEFLLNRKALSLVNAVGKKTGAYMVAGNIASAISNTIPIVQANGYIGSLGMLKGIYGTLFVHDGLAERSDFLTSRLGKDSVTHNWTDKVSDALGVPMNIVDGLAAETIVRARYNQNLGKGMSETSALEEADGFAARVMAGRSKGEMPILFETKNPVIKMLSQFQLEVNNQFSEMFKDMPREYQGQAWKLAAVFMRYFIGAFLLNDILERLLGRRIAFDPIDIVNEFVGDLTGYKLPNYFGETMDYVWHGEKFEAVEKTNKENLGVTTANLSTDVAKEIPFIGTLFGGGRYPTATAFTSPFAYVKDTLIPTLWNENLTAGEKAAAIGKDVLGASLRLLPFGGGNQIKKTFQGIKTSVDGGSFKTNNKGERTLQYPFYTDEGVRSVGNAVRAAVFGKSSLPTAREWVESDFSSLNADETEGYLEAIATGESQRAVFETIMSIKTLEPAPGETSVTQDQKRKALLSSSLSSDAKYAIFVNVIANKTELELIDSLFDSGLKEDDVIKYMLSSSGIERELKEDGTRKSVSDVQKWRVIADGNYSDTDKLKLVKEVSSETQYLNFELCLKYGVPFDAYVTLKEHVAEYDEDENKSYSNDEIKTAIDSLFVTVQNIPLSTSAGTTQLTKEGKAVLWQLVTGSTSANSNPYGNYRIARDIIKDKKDRKEAS